MRKTIATPKQKAQKKFNKAFDIADGVSFGQMQHGYLYLKYFDLYIYKMRQSLGAFLPDGPDAVRPEREIHEDIEALIDMQVRHSNTVGRKIETNAYHAKVMRYEDARKIFHLKDDLNLPNLPKTIIPYEVARRAIIKSPQRIINFDCPCRNTRGEKGCRPRGVCMLLGEPWATWGMENIPDANPRVITQEEALKIIEEQRDMGNVQSAFFKDACGDRLYALCNCCSCCCVAMASLNYANIPTFAKSGYIIASDIDKCIGCGICEKSCHFFACKVKDGKVDIDHPKCYGCGVCVKACPKDALRLELDDPSVSAPLDLSVLAPECLKD